MSFTIGSTRERKEVRVSAPSEKLSFVQKINYKTLKRPTNVVKNN